MAARPGLTLTEVLIATAIGGTVVALSIQQVQQYFRLQQVLITRTQLRQEAKNAQEVVAQRLRYAISGFQVRGSEMVAVVLDDEDHDGVITDHDRARVYWWRGTTDPLAPGQYFLQELQTDLPAFLGPANPEDLLKAFELGPKPGRRLASSFESGSFAEKQKGIIEFTLTMSQAVQRQKEPVRLTLSELVAVRSRPLLDPTRLPTFEEVLEAEKRKEPR